MWNVSTSEMESRLIQNGVSYVGAAVVDLDSVIWAIALPPETSAQKTELTALTQALKLTKGAIATVDMPLLWLLYMGHIPRENIIDDRRKTHQNLGKNILALLAALWFPFKMAIFHCPRHQKGISKIA